jgi:xanthine/CO dehydrogenase XdhC/CoxF family maturation factor
METIYPILDWLRHHDRPCVLATIIRVEGSAYRKEGTSMLLLDDGSQVGLLSGGCLEEDLAAHAGQVLAGGLSHTVIYDMRAEDDLSWGQGTGCNGLVHVLLEPVGAWLREQLLRVESCLEQRKSVISIRKLNHNFGTDRITFLTGSGDAFGHEPSDILLAEGAGDPVRPDWGRTGRPVFLRTDRTSLYFQRYDPKPRLIIFGAGPDAKPLVQLASQTGFSVTLCDWREAMCSRERFPLADEIIVGPPEETAAALKLDSRDAVVLMTHHFQHDRALAEKLLHRELLYLGILGPRRRTSRLMGEREIPKHVRSPVGLPIGAEGPEEIAVSIMADIVGKLRLTSEERTRVLHGSK